MEDSYQEFKKILIGNRRYVTRQREQIFELMCDTPAPLSFSEVAKKLDGRVDRASVYRNLYALTKLGILKKVTIAFEDKYELSDRFFQHHHHLTCVKCSKVIKIKLGDRLEGAIDNFGVEHGFKITSHEFELRGLCANCQQ
jgi:Fe2+ or Zn2+ uptake regulation protein